ncbi:MAG: serine/threonine protein kinase [Firmicutes bacterium]|nr:serine/threonine protein kinase [Bacillota bacterium]MCM1401702.1 serine/threonine protein kinase [Bacteroides sp.]MCM1477510.1 serine/threonine protein kinase [Bacteroides sp.]
MTKEVNSLPPMSRLNSGSSTYIIRNVIGSGGFGITYLATTTVKVGNLTVTPNVAIKELFISADCDRTITASGETTIVTSGPARARVESATSDFIAEANRLHALSGQNDNIVNVNEVFTANGTAYYVMEYLDGPSLRDYIAQRGALSEAETRAIMIPIIKAVAFLHSRRIMHLDIKPGNIVMATTHEGKQRPTLIDFGQSKHYGANGEATYTIAQAGLSEGYAPIEQYAGIKSFSPPTDVYALAATMLHCLTGKKPLQAVNVTPEYVDSVLPDYVSPEMRRALKNALALQPSTRTGSAEELLLDMGCTIISPNAPKHPKHPAPPKPIRPWWPWVIMGLLVAGIILAAMVIYMNRERSYTPPPILSEQAEEAATVDYVDAPAAETVAEPAEEASAVKAAPEMRTYNFRGAFIDNKGREWPVRITANTDNAGKWGSCSYDNVYYNVYLNLYGSGSDNTFTFYSNDKGADLTIRISYQGDNIWTGTATSGSKTLRVRLSDAVEPQ